jgi:multidrug efflux pump subunit AcrA (membrane-fusion protein)
MKSTPNTLTGAALLALSVFVSFFGCEKEKAAEFERQLLQNETLPPAEEKPIYTVEQGRVTKKIQFLSQIAPVDEKYLFFREDGRVRIISVEESDWVKAGDVLAELEMTDLLNDIKQAEVSVEKARMHLEELSDNRVGIAEAEAELRIKKLKLEQLSKNPPKAKVAIAKAALEKASLDLEEARVSDQVYGQNEPTANLRRAMLNHQIAEANHNLALQELASHDLQLKILEEDINLARIKLEKLQDDTDPLAINDLKMAELTLKQLKDQADMHRIISPIDGQVMNISIFTGSEARAYNPYFIVADPSTFEVSADLLSTTVLQLSVNQEVEIELVDQPGQILIGWIRRLPYNITRQGTDALENADRSTRIQFNPPRDLTLEVGDLARATIVLERKENVLYLPPEAIRVYQGRRFVVVQEGDMRRRVDVKTGLTSEERVEIEEGLRVGQTIVGQ